MLLSLLYPIITIIIIIVVIIIVIVVVIIDIMMMMIIIHSFIHSYSITSLHWERGSKLSSLTLLD